MSVTRRRPGPSPVSVSARRGSVQVSEVQRARMLSSAAVVVSEYGYGQMSVARVTAGARVSRRTFYDVFEDREDCFLAVFDVALSRLSEPVVSAYERERAWREKVRAALGVLLVFLDEQPEVASLLVVDALQAGPRVLRRRAEVLGRLGMVLDRGGWKAKSAKGLPELTGEGVVGAVFSVIHTRLLADYAGSLVELLNPLMGMIVLPYQGSAAARRELDRKSPPGRRGASRSSLERPARPALRAGRNGDASEASVSRLRYASD
jgi:AcrR family transcriptional regulator